MKRSTLKLIERQVSEFRQSVGLSDSEAVNLKSLLLKLKVLTLFRPLSNSFSGMSLKSPKGEGRFMLVNSNQPRSRQHFTIAHELYHLFIDENPIPHNCSIDGVKDESEQCADAFAQMFLMPAEGILQIIPEEELATKISLGTIIRAEQYFSVSRHALLNRLKDLGYISQKEKDAFFSLPVKHTAKQYGYDTSLYEPANENLVIGDFGEKARRLFEEEKISEGHYLELLSKIGIDGSED